MVTVDTTHVVMVTVDTRDGNSGHTAHVMVTSYCILRRLVHFFLHREYERQKERERERYRLIWYYYLPVFWQRRSWDSRCMSLQLSPIVRASVWNVEHLVWKLLPSLLPVLSPASTGQLLSHTTSLILQLCLLVPCRELSRYDRESAFPEKREYRPNVKIEYVDDDGRLLSTKEVV